MDMSSIAPSWNRDMTMQECEHGQCSRTDVWHCAECASSYCSQCWDLQGPHNPQKKLSGRAKHEKIDPGLARSLDAILNPDSEDASTMHKDDREAKWIGLSGDGMDGFVLEDYGRYASLMRSLKGKQADRPQHPHIVSFVGETNAGKSTIIKLLINNAIAHHDSLSASKMASPVAGTVLNEWKPTTGDIHLYCDPGTAESELPLLYADCEGLRGGEATPVGAQPRRSGDNDTSDGDSFGTKQSRIHHIPWACTTKTRKREFAVAALFPRFLYAFSDCVVFVLRNPKTIQAALQQLLEWGSQALEKSINQPPLPHCIVVLNDVSPAHDDREWELDVATESLLRSVDEAFGTMGDLAGIRSLRKHWRNIGHTVQDVKSLLLCFYSTFRVLRVPSKPGYARIDRQIGRLREAICDSCELSLAAKKRACANLDADELEVNIHNALGHFATHLDKPFNFIRVPRENGVVQSRKDLPGYVKRHALHLFVAIGKQSCNALAPDSRDFELGQAFFDLIPLLSSAVQLDCSRQRYNVSQLQDQYLNGLSLAFLEYLDLHHPCRGRVPETARKCELVKARHGTQGHQDGQGVFLVGNYEAELKMGDWEELMMAELIDMDCRHRLAVGQAGWSTASVAGEDIAWRMHLATLNKFFGSHALFEEVHIARICSHATCFVCILAVPEHILACGHTICTACVKAFGIRDDTAIRLDRCPLSCELSKPAVVRLIPPGAGLRVLVLEGGGGIRAIVQLELLQAVQRVLVQLGGHLPIRSLFDLIVGAGIGALNAVLLQAAKESNNDSRHAFTDPRQLFAQICRAAFSSKRLKIPSLLRRPKHPSRGLLDVLKTTFHLNTRLFRYHSQPYPVPRVALVCADFRSHASAVLANYRRPESHVAETPPPYRFEQPDEPESEMTVWESIAQCMADQFAPIVFRDGIFNLVERSGVVLSAIEVAVAEAELISTSPLDFLLSLGVSKKERERSNIMHLIRRPHDPVDDKAWARLKAGDSQGAEARRYIRLSGEELCDQLPLDDPSGISQIQQKAQQLISKMGTKFGECTNDIPADTLRRSLEYIAYRLVATCFYITNVPPQAVVSSTGFFVACRFPLGSDEMAALTAIVRQRKSGNFRPHFAIWLDQTRTQKLVFPVSMSENHILTLPIDANINDPGEFIICNLCLIDNDLLAPDGLPISGSPQQLDPFRACPVLPHGKSYLAAATGSLTSGKELRPVSASPSQMDSPTLTTPVRFNAPAQNDHLEVPFRSSRDKTRSDSAPQSSVTRRRQSIQDLKCLSAQETDLRRSRRMTADWGPVARGLSGVSSTTSIDDIIRMWDTTM